jgi:endonuclease/exonuclease/phosphatase family metal-dependent hydrolase
VLCQRNAERIIFIVVFRSITKGFLLTLTGICTFAYLLSATAPFVSPAKAPLMGFIGLAFPLFLFLMLLWLVFWLIASSKYSLIPLGALIMSSYSLYHYFSFNFGAQKIPQDKKTFSVLTYNVKVFDLYWTKDAHSSRQILKAIFDADADIVCLQEFYTDNSENFNMLKKLSEVYPYHHFENTLTLRGTDKWGIATFSKFPIRRKEAIRFEQAQHNLAIASDIFIDGNPVKVYNAHLQSIHLNDEEIESIERIADSIRWKPMDNALIKMYHAFRWRAVQAEKLKAHINNASSHVIVAGDFNDTPNSYVYRTLSKGMNDTFDKAGKGIGYTYFGKLPAFRIDYILLDKKFTVHSHRVIRNPRSDHFAVKAVFSME